MKFVLLMKNLEGELELRQKLPHISKRVDTLEKK